MCCKISEGVIGDIYIDFIMNTDSYLIIRYCEENNLELTPKETEDFYKFFYFIIDLTIERLENVISDYPFIREDLSLLNTFLKWLDHKDYDLVNKNWFILENKVNERVPVEWVDKWNILKSFNKRLISDCIEEDITPQELYNIKNLNTLLRLIAKDVPVNTIILENID